VATAALLFVLGFSIIFTALGAVASGVGATLLEHRDLAQRLAGIVILLLGILLLALCASGLMRPQFMLIEKRPLLSRARPGPAGALGLGMAFAAGWTPCIGPVLGGTLLLASSQATVSAGAGLLLLYSLGLGIPFVAAAFCLDRFQVVAKSLRKWSLALNVAGGLLLIAMGVLIFLDRLNQLLAPALELYARVGWPPL
jgi:cytochrome c-type biogenesis protein